VQANPRPQYRLTQVPPLTQGLGSHLDGVVVVVGRRVVVVVVGRFVVVVVVVVDVVVVGVVVPVAGVEETSCSSALRPEAGPSSPLVTSG